MTRAERRYRWDLAKRRAARVWQRWNRGNAHGEVLKGWSWTGGVATKHFYTAGELARSLAYLAETHCCPCSCRGCTRGRDVPPPRERAFN